jgi:hypothetical protein
MPRTLVLLLLALVICGGMTALLMGCGDGGKAITVPLHEVPEPLLKTAKEKLPAVKFDHARRLPNGNFEIRGKARNGKVREVEVTPAGEVVEIE